MPEGTNGKESKVEVRAELLLTRFWFLRGLALVYMTAFASLIPQVHGLWGTFGISPVAKVVDAVQAQTTLLDRMVFFPTLFHVNASDDFLFASAVAGTVVSLAAVLGLSNAIVFLLLWFLYLSFVTAGGVFLSYQWDILLLESGFLAIFLAPLSKIEPPLTLVWRRPMLDHGANAPSAIHSSYQLVAMIWLVRWLLFRLMFESGIVKVLSGDPTWRSLTALKFHYWTQPLPTPLAYFFDKFPDPFQTFCCLMVFVIELLVPFLIWAPARFRKYAVLPLIGLQVLIASTGNYTYFNLLTVVLCLSLLDDRFWTSITPKALAEAVYAAGEKSSSPLSLKLSRVMAAFAVTIVVSASAFKLAEGIFFLRRDVPPQVLPIVEFLSAYRIVSEYGLFAVMTTRRMEIVLEGSNDGKSWLSYEFPYKPGQLNRAPPLVAPYQPRLDWQMWFAALGDYQSNPWFVRFSSRILEGSPSVLALMEKNPFPQAPPKFLRAMFYEYRFSSLDELTKSGNWWQRKLVGTYMPPASISADAHD